MREQKQISNVPSQIRATCSVLCECQIFARSLDASSGQSLNSCSSQVLSKLLVTMAARAMTIIGVTLHPGTGPTIHPVPYDCNNVTDTALHTALDKCLSAAHSIHSQLSARSFQERAPALTTQIWPSPGHAHACTSHQSDCGPQRHISACRFAVNFLARGLPEAQKFSQL